MTDDIVSLRLLIVSGAAPERQLLRQGAGAASIPVDVVEAENASKAIAQLSAGDTDLILIDSALPPEERASVIKAARATKKPPIVAVLAPGGATPGEIADAPSDGVLAKPANDREAEAAIGKLVRLRVPSRVLVVDDSSTMRSIIRKILSASRFPMDMTDAEEGISALKQISTGRFDFVMLDYNMPGLNGVETLSEIKRQYPKIEVVMVTSTPDEEIAEKARAAGAAAFLKKPFFPADIDTVFIRMCGIRKTAA